jgi:hypothetical protein
VRIAHRSQVDVGDGVARDDHERAVGGEELAGLAHPARGAERLGLIAVGERYPQARAVPEVLLDLLGQIGDVGDDIGEPVPGQQLGDVLHHRPVEDGRHRLRHPQGQRAQAGAEPGGEDHGAHGRGGYRRLIRIFTRPEASPR